MQFEILSVYIDFGAFRGLGTLKIQRGVTWNSNQESVLGLVSRKG
uniref:Uncharacterized protein n=1 Tax=Rhizophora mucronata TaxID=61149 RepID=A0A2P2NE98_RHIMU